MNLFLWTRILFADLNFSGTTPDEIEILNKLANGTDKTFVTILRIFTGRLYGPTDLPGFKFEIWVSTSERVIGNG